MDDLKTAILGYVRREYIEEGDERELTADTPLISSGIVDSFSMVSLKRFLERTCGMKIPDELATPEAFDTVNRVEALVESLRAKTAGGQPA
jgi:acyl carrier protein